MRGVSGAEADEQGALVVVACPVTAMAGFGPVVRQKCVRRHSITLPRVEDDEMVQAVPADRADQTFEVGILPGTPGL